MNQPTEVPPRGVIILGKNTLPQQLLHPKLSQITFSQLSPDELVRTLKQEKQLAIISSKILRQHLSCSHIMVVA